MAYQIFVITRTERLIPSTSAISTRRGEAASALRWLLAVLIAASFLNCGSVNDAWAQTYRGKVVDAETGQSLEGAVFVIVWSKKTAISVNGSRNVHSAKEALTDSKGEFSLDGSPGLDWNPFTYVLRDPDIVIYMPGYGPFPVGHVKEPPIGEMIKAMTGAGAVIKLPKLKTQEEMRRYTSPGDLQISIKTPREKVPNLIRLINIQRKFVGVPQYENPAR